MAVAGKGGTNLATATILMPGVNNAPDAKDDSKTMMPNDPMSNNVINPNDSDPEGNDLKVNKVVLRRCVPCVDMILVRCIQAP